MNIHLKDKCQSNSSNALWMSIVVQKCFSDSFIYDFTMCYNSDKVDTREFDMLGKNVWSLRKEALSMTDTLIWDPCEEFE